MAGNVENSVALEAWYVNDSAVRAELYRKHVTGSVTEGVMAVRLNTSSLLHARLVWRPEFLREAKVERLPLAPVWLPVKFVYIFSESCLNHTCCLRFRTGCFAAVYVQVMR